MIYFLKKSGIPEKIISETITDLLSFLYLRSADKQDFLAALDLGFSDLEDAIQYQTAFQITGINYFITSNIKDFKNAPKTLQVLSPKQFLNIITI